MDDSISRQAAIDALCRRCDLVAEDDEPCTEKCNDIKILEQLPPAQPEPPEDICGECDAWNKYKSEHKTGRWIPCSERLPDEYGEYLVTKHTIGWNCEEYVSNDIAYFDNDGFHKADTVIAWMPLPEPHRAERRTDERTD